METIKAKKCPVCKNEKSVVKGGYRAPKDFDKVIMFVKCSHCNIIVEGREKENVLYVWNAIPREDDSLEDNFAEPVVEREGYITCCNCGKPLSDNQMVKDSYLVATQHNWLKQQVRIVADMLKDSGNVHGDKLHELIEKADKHLKF